MRRGTITALGALVLVAVMLAACTKEETTETHQKEMMRKSFDESKKAAAATVNGEVVTMFSLFREMNAIAPQYLKPGQKQTPELDRKIREDALRNVITVTLAVQEARRSGLTVPPGTIDKEIRKMREKAGSEKAFQDYLAGNGLREDELRSMVERDALFEMIAAREVDAKIRVTDAALRARYRKDRANLKDARHRQMTFEEARGLVEQEVRTEAAEKRMREWEKELRKNARIEITAGNQRKG